MGNVRVEISSTFRLMVDYDVSLDRAIAAGQYSWWEQDRITEHYFRRHEETGEKNRELVLVNFKSSMWTDEVLSELSRLGLIPARLYELLALGASHPEEQQNTAIVALGTIVHTPAGRDVALLDGYKEVPSRRLVLYFYDKRPWHSGYSFAAVPLGSIQK